ncbi:MAG: hypothetical protein IPL39_03310 [Opitutaceae bacterium]|nr:hypothetical protein [Opitutaceae bacterium]
MLLGLAWLQLAVPSLQAQGYLLPQAAPGLIETGTPPFVLLRPDAMGLSAPATDLHELPNGAILAVNESELAVGDGVRWQTFQRASDTEQTTLNQVIVDRDGSIYAGVGGGIARIELSEDGQWRFHSVVAMPRSTPAQDRLLSRVVALDGEWYWHNGSGPLVAWHPGTAPRFLCVVNDIECLFSAGGAVFVTDAATGGLFRVAADKLEPVETGIERTLEGAATSATALPEGQALLGVNGRGLMRFDGRTLAPFAQPGSLLGGRHRIKDLCRVGDNLYAAALDTYGIAFFNQEGRVLQVIERTTSLPLARVRRLVGGTGGIVWALLNDGVACVAFPSRVSDLQSYVTTGLTYSRTYRHEGRLWLVSDGRVQRGIYDEDGRLIRFDTDSPAGFVSSLATGLGPLLACGHDGLYQHDTLGWKLAIPGPVNAHVCGLPTMGRRSLYTATNEVGWLWYDASGLHIERFPFPGLGETFVGVLRGEAAYWVELGAGRVARITVPDGRPVVRILEQKDGLPESWVQLFVLDNDVRFNVAGQFLRYDEASDRVVADTDSWFGSRKLSAGYGRPIRDAIGRVWFTSDDTVRVIRPESDDPTKSLEWLPTAITPLFLTPESDGVVWLHQRQQLLRFDPRLSCVPPAPLRAVLSHVQRMGSNSHAFFPLDELAPLEFGDNSLAVHFLAPGAIFGRPVTFETRLEGGGDQWLPAGAVGVAYLNRLKEGRYRLHVRPRSGQTLGLEATLAFTVLPPWYRTGLAYGLYALGGVALVGLAAGGWMALGRREKRRLELLVRKRTAELQRSEERYRLLGEELEGRVAARTAELAKANAERHRAKTAEDRPQGPRAP